MLSFNTYKLTQGKTEKIEEMASLWSFQESIDELQQRIHQIEHELEAAKAIRNDEMNINTNSLKQLLQLLELVRHERDEARGQFQRLLIKITPNSSITNPAKPKSISIPESNTLSAAYAYNHISSPVSYPHEFYNNTEMKLCNGFQAFRNFQEIDHDTLMMNSMIEGKVLPQKGNLLQAVMEAGPLLQTLLVAQCGSFSQMTVGGGGGGGGGGGLSFDDQGRSMVAGCHRDSIFGLGAKRQRFR